MLLYGNAQHRRDRRPAESKGLEKERYPVLKTDAERGIYGPGHNSFVKSEDGKEDIMIYHARPYDEIIGDPLYDPNRHAYRMRIKWNEQGRPVFDYCNNY